MNHQKLGQQSALLLNDLITIYSVLGTMHINNLYAQYVKHACVLCTVYSHCMPVKKKGFNGGFIVTFILIGS